MSDCTRPNLDREEKEKGEEKEGSESREQRFDIIHLKVFSAIETKIPKEGISRRKKKIGACLSSG
jgi:hypothetical protein